MIIEDNSQRELSTGRQGDGPGQSRYPIPYIHEITSALARNGHLQQSLPRPCVPRRRGRQPSRRPSALAMPLRHFKASLTTSAADYHLLDDILITSSSGSEQWEHLQLLQQLQRLQSHGALQSTTTNAVIDNRRLTSSDTASLDKA